jgi:hypothetical protein
VDGDDEKGGGEGDEKLVSIGGDGQGGKDCVVENDLQLDSVDVDFEEEEVDEIDVEDGDV